MPADTSQTRKPPLRVKLAPEKGNELVGWLLLALGLLLTLSLGSYSPRDPSFFHSVPGPEVRTHNLIGKLGAEVSAVAVQFLGPTALLVPALLLIGGWRR